MKNVKKKDALKYKNNLTYSDIVHLCVAAYKAQQMDHKDLSTVVRKVLQFTETKYSHQSVHHAAYKIIFQHQF